MFARVKSFFFRTFAEMCKGESVYSLLAYKPIIKNKYNKQLKSIKT